MTGLTLSSGGVGSLTIQWDTPSSTPSDYRVMWARADLDYPSWNADNEAQRGNEYPTDAEMTLSGLTKGADFKVRIRARYRDGEHADDPWSGPWTDEAAQRVRGDPPSALTELLTATLTGDEETSVTLSWTAPEHSALTGYRIQRGPEAGSLAVLVEDTGHTATSYTDGTVEADTSYAYAVTALSLDGDSPRSETVEVEVEGTSQPIAANQISITPRQDQGGVVTLSQDPPDMGVPVTASLADADGGVMGEAWQWSKADTTTSTFTNISGTTSATYRPAEADLGKFLKASVSYSDALGSGKSASLTATNAVLVEKRRFFNSVDVPIAFFADTINGYSTRFRTGGHPSGYNIENFRF